ncbi:MAG: prepilin-type N-terminal cleavage/methylation domain-containing protein [Lentisphaerae bacterium]|nr:prepilin-type N-terminal cleavage/methylation domain-containing protein [Lentisphaerota bacterium]
MKADVQKFGFSLVELMIAVSLFGLAMGGAVSVYIMCQKLWRPITLSMAANREASLGLNRLVYGVGTNSGLRTAASISINSNMNGIWSGSYYPPDPGDERHFLNPGLDDGSWRITCSNAYDGQKWIDYNSAASNIVLWVDPPPSAVNRRTRQLIANYVSEAVVSNGALGVSIQLTIVRRGNGDSLTNRSSTYIKRRN